MSEKTKIEKLGSTTNSVTTKRQSVEAQAEAIVDELAEDGDDTGSTVHAVVVQDDEDEEKEKEEEEEETKEQENESKGDEKERGQDKKEDEGEGDGEKKSEKEETEEQKNSTNNSGEQARIEALVMENVKSQPGLRQQNKWEDMFKRLVAFKEKYNHCLVPNRYLEDPQLGSWVSTQRRHYKTLMSGSGSSTPMTPARAKRLESLGFQWSTTDPRHVPWESRYQELADFYKKYGHSQVPIGWEENVQLSNWVSTQRQEYKLIQKGRQSRLSHERIEMLNKIGFIWEAQRGGPRRKRKATVQVPSQPNPVDADKPTRASAKAFARPDKRSKTSTKQNTEGSDYGNEGGGGNDRAGESLQQNQEEEKAKSGEEARNPDPDPGAAPTTGVTAQPASPLVFSPALPGAGTSTTTVAPQPPNAFPSAVPFGVTPWQILANGAFQQQPVPAVPGMNLFPIAAQWPVAPAGYQLGMMPVLTKVGTPGTIFPAAPGQPLPAVFNNGQEYTDTKAPEPKDKKTMKEEKEKQDASRKGGEGKAGADADGNYKTEDKVEKQDASRKGEEAKDGADADGNHKTEDKDDKEKQDATRKGEEEKDGMDADNNHKEDDKDGKEKPEPKDKKKMKEEKEKQDASRKVGEGKDGAGTDGIDETEGKQDTGRKEGEGNDGADAHGIDKTEDKDVKEKQDASRKGGEGKDGADAGGDNEAEEVDQEEPKTSGNVGDTTKSTNSETKPAAVLNTNDQESKEKNESTEVEE